MPLSTFDLAQAREITSELLEELGLEAYLFEVEPSSEQWLIKVECAIPEGWESVRLPIQKENLLVLRQDSSARRQLLDAWRDRLTACKINHKS